MEGSVTERVLPDGRALVHVNLRMHNALMWVTRLQSISDQGAGGERVFGNLAHEVALGAAPALGDSQLEFDFINAGPNQPLPDWMQVAFEPGPGQEQRRLSFTASAIGTLPDGSLARASVVQTGLLQTPFRGAVGDAFPVEMISVQPIGR